MNHWGGVGGIQLTEFRHCRLRESIRARLKGTKNNEQGRGNCIPKKVKKKDGNHKSLRDAQKGEGGGKGRAETTENS